MECHERILCGMSGGEKAVFRDAVSENFTDHADRGVCVGRIYFSAGNTGAFSGGCDSDRSLYCLPECKH